MDDFVCKLKERLHYCPDNGVFTYLVTRGHKVKGEIAGTLNSHGYIKISFDNKSYLAHRLVFVYMTGEWPKNFVDHKDTNRANNKWDNLRDVERRVNARNKSMQVNNKSGVTGVSWDKLNNKWVSNICVKGHLIYLGRFEHKEDAIFARLTAEKENGYWQDKVWDQL